MKRHKLGIFPFILLTCLATFLIGCGGGNSSSDDTENNSSDNVSLTPTPTPTVTPTSLPGPCADAWPDLIVRGLNEGDQIEVNWNPGWQGAFTGRIGNGTIENRAFSYCGTQEDYPDNYPSLSFELVNTDGYTCTVDESEAVSHVIVECTRDVTEAPAVCGDNWITLNVSGLSGSDEIGFSWNLDWSGGYSGRTGNGEINDRHFSYCGPVEDRPSFSFEITDSAGYTCTIDNSDPVNMITVECEPETPTATPAPVLCGDSWPTLRVSGLAEGDEIEYSWNLDWQGGHTARVGNGERNHFHFSFCGAPGEFPPGGFDLIDTTGYVCVVDDSDAASHVTVECSVDVVLKRISSNGPHSMGLLRRQSRAKYQRFFC